MTGPKLAGLLLTAPSNEKGVAALLPKVPYGDC